MITQPTAQDVIIERARSLHRVVRALHDGHCPSCGHIFQPHEQVASHGVQAYADREQCPKCKFTITHEEAEAVCKEFAPIMRKNLEVFEEWRANRKQ